MQWHIMLRSKSRRIRSRSIFNSSSKTAESRVLNLNCKRHGIGHMLRSLLITKHCWLNPLFTFRSIESLRNRGYCICLFLMFLLIISLLSRPVLLISESQWTFFTYYCLLWLLLLFSGARVAEVTAIIISQVCSRGNLFYRRPRFLLLDWSTHLIWVIHHAR